MTKEDLKLLELLEYQQNTINDFYTDTIYMLNDLFDLLCTKVDDNLIEGKLYTKTRVLEILCFAVRYVMTFARGQEFNEKEKIGVNVKKLKALEIFKDRVDIKFQQSDLAGYAGVMIINYIPYYIHSKHDFDLLKEVFE